MLENLNNGGSLVKAMFGGNVSALAGGSGDNTEVKSPWINRLGYLSGKVSFGYSATLADTKTLSGTFKIYDSEDGGDTTLTTTTLQAKTVLATGTTTITSFEDVEQVDFNLEGYAQYIQLGMIPDLSNTSTDTVFGYVHVDLTGATKLPAHTNR